MDFPMPDVKIMHCKVCGEEVKVNESSDSLDKNQSSVRRLSLFDTFDNDTKKPDHPSNLEKTEPVFSKKSNEDVDEVNYEEKISEEEFSGESDSEDDFNQETEEELLDIPTFLRRQAN